MQVTPGVYTGINDGISKIYAAEGLKGCMQGATPTFIGFLMQGALKYGRKCVCGVCMCVVCVVCVCVWCGYVCGVCMCVVCVCVWCVYVCGVCGVCMCVVCVCVCVRVQGATPTFMCFLFLCLSHTLHTHAHILLYLSDVYTENDRSLLQKSPIKETICCT